MANAPEESLADALASGRYQRVKAPPPAKRSRRKVGGQKQRDPHEGSETLALPDTSEALRMLDADLSALIEQSVRAREKLARANYELFLVQRRIRDALARAVRRENQQHADELNRRTSPTRVEVIAASSPEGSNEP
jgi:hypothetical protein